jgi:hypothetical protein
MDRLLPSEVELVRADANTTGRGGAGWDHDGLASTSLQAEAGISADLPSAQGVEAAPALGGWRPAHAVADVPRWEFGLVRISPTGMCRSYEVEV